MYQSARWVSPPEVVWRIFGFALYDMSPSIIDLQLHLENYQCIIYKEFDGLEEIVKNDYYKKSMSTEYFCMNISNSKAKTFLYREFSEHFVWNSQCRIWSERKKIKRSQ